jgi:O-antigen ligase
VVQKEAAIRINIAPSRNLIAFWKTNSNARWLEVVLALTALCIGFALARLSLLPLLVGLVGIAVVIAILREPLIGLALTLIAAPFVALERIVLGLPLDSGQVLLLLTLGAWLLRGLARREIRLPAAPLTIPLLLFTGAIALSLWNAFSVAAGLTELLKWVEVIAVYWFVVETVDRKKLPWLAGMVLAAALAQAGAGVWQFALRGIGPEHFQIPGTSFYRAYGGFEQPNPFAGYIGLTLPLAIGLLMLEVGNWMSDVGSFTFHATLRGNTQYAIRITPHRIASHITFLLALCALLLAAALVASWSRGAWLGAGAAVAVMLAFWPRRWWLGVSGVALVAAVLIGGSALGVLPAAIRTRLTDFTQYTQIYDARGAGVNDVNYAVIERLAHWQAAAEMIRARLWTGVGLGNYEAAYETFRLLKWPYALGHAHNYLLNITAETGLPGLLAYLFLWGAILWQTFRALGETTGWQRGLALGLLGVWAHLHIHNLVDNLYVSNIWIHLAVLLGILTIVKRET